MQTKKQKQEKALAYWERELEKRLELFDKDSYKVKYPREQIHILRQKLGKA